MKRYLLDTNVIIHILNNPKGSLSNTLKQHNPKDIYVSCIVMYELFYGAFNSKRIESNLLTLDNLQFKTLEFDEEDAKESGEIRVYLSQRGIIIGPYDLLIAGQARARGMILITHNTKEFSRIPSLRIEDWKLN